jgi:hypothetical protein
MDLQIMQTRLKWRLRNRLEGGCGAKRSRHETRLACGAGAAEKDIMKKVWQKVFE